MRSYGCSCFIQKMKVCGNFNATSHHLVGEDGTDPIRSVLVTLERKHAGWQGSSPLPDEAMNQQ